MEFRPAYFSSTECFWHQTPILHTYLEKISKPFPKNQHDQLIYSITIRLLENLFFLMFTPHKNYIPHLKHQNSFKTNHFVCQYLCSMFCFSYYRASSISLSAFRMQLYPSTRGSVPLALAEQHFSHWDF